MGTGWRRAFCTSIRRDSDTAAAEKGPDANPSPRICTKLRFFSGGGGRSNPSTPRLRSLRCRTKSTPPESPKLQWKTATVSSSRTPPPPANPKQSPTLLHRGSSNPSSPRSPSTFALFKAALHLSRSRCGLCEQSVKASGGAAVFTAECSHSFHFPCIAAHVRTCGGVGTLGCPVCSAAWRQAPPFLSFPGHHKDDEPQPSVLVGDKKLTHRPRMSRGDERGGSEAEKNRPVSAVAAVKKAYDDDEPLLLSTKSSQGGAGVLFNPIPEADEDDCGGGNEDDELEAEEEEEEEEEEFRGLLAKDHNYSDRSRFPSCKATAGIKSACARGVEVSMMSEAALLSSGPRHQNYVVALKVKAPAAAPLLSHRRRAPIDLVTVLDVSGGMTGAKIQMLKRAMRLVISSLGPADRLSVVAFSTAAAKRLLPLRRMSRPGQRSARQIVERLVVSCGGQGSCVGDALRKATKVLEDRRERNPVATIMLLSDGQQQQDAKKCGYDYGQCTSTATVATTRFAHVEIPIHASRVGDMPQQPLPRQSSSPAAPVDDAFAKCVGGLVSVVMQDVRLQLFFPSGEVSAVYSCGVGGAVVLGSSVRLGDLYSEEERELLVELRVSTAAGPDQHRHSLSVKCGYRDPATQEVICCSERPLPLPPLLIERQGHPQLAFSASSNSLRLRNLFVTTRAVVESRRLAEISDHATALHLLCSARSLLLQTPTISDQDRGLICRLEADLADLQQRRGGQMQQSLAPCLRRRKAPIPIPGGEQQLTPTSAWRAAEQLAKVAITRKSLNRVGDLHGFENARF